jgi:N-acetylglucosamine malate deacetylase 1
MKVLFISPHPDDVEIGCGATVVRLVEEGHQCDLAVVVGEGDLLMEQTGELVEFKRRKYEQSLAGIDMGIKTLHYLEVAPASRLDTVGVSVLTGKLDALLRDQAYDTLYVPLPSHNQDHNYVWEAVQAATRPGRADHMRILAYEQPTQGHGMQLCNQLRGVVYNRVSWRHMQKKNKAIQRHESQMQQRSNTLTGIGGTTLLAQFRGMEVGTPFAEMFYLLRDVT